MKLQCQVSGKIITIDTANLIASGGEGRIYRVLQDSSLVAKIYHKPTLEDGDKLTVMFSLPPNAPMAAPGHPAIAWPIDLLKTLDKNPKIIGFLMPRVSRVSPIHIFYTPKTRREQKPLFNYLYLHRTARNLASAVSALHQRGYIIGDLNESNILVSDTALVTLVDTDSFQVKDPYTDHVYRCPVGKPEFTPPELQGQSFRTIDRQFEHDLFGLGVLIFQLLMEGTHPFSGVYLGTDEPPTLETRIRQGAFPYSPRKIPFRPMIVAPDFQLLHPQLRELFIRCFEEGYRQPSARPDAKIWATTLKLAEDSLITCPKNNQHKYGDHLSFCPWCERTKKLKGRDPFPSREAVNHQQHLQPIKTKKKRQLPSSITVKSTPITPQPKSHALIQPIGQYQPPLIPISHSNYPPTPSFPLTPQEYRLRDFFGGIFWGISFFFALFGLIFALYDPNGGAVLGGILVGMTWGAFFGLVWSLLIPPFPVFWGRTLAILLGALKGGFLLSVISAILFSILKEKWSMIMIPIILGLLLGGFWGILWNSCKPPLTIHYGRVLGIKGALFGATWGTFIGTYLGIIVSFGLFFSHIYPQNSPVFTPDLITSLIGMVVITSGFGSLGGLIMGAILGMLGFSPQLPVSFQPIGVKGGILGAIWGTLLGTLGGFVIGIILAILSPDYRSLSNFPISPLIGNFIGTGIIAAGLGTLWGSLSGSVWGSLGRF